MITQFRHSIPTLLVVALAFSVAGCAGSAGSAKPVTAPVKTESLAHYTKLSLETSAQGDDVSELTEDVRERIAGLVAGKVNQLAPGRFAEIAPDPVDPQTLQVSIAFTRYDKGNTFARAMLAGLGQIHIDADVTLADPVAQSVIGKYEVKKTFAWGGLYGGMTGIEDVENGFAEAVAKVLLGEPDK